MSTTCCLKGCGSTGWCGTVDCVLAYELKGHWSGSLSGHQPMLQARSLVGECVQEATDEHFSGTSLFLTLFFSLTAPSPKLVNKYSILKKGCGKLFCIPKTSL